MLLLLATEYYLLVGLNVMKLGSTFPLANTEEYTTVPASVHVAVSVKAGGVYKRGDTEPIL